MESRVVIDDLVPCFDGKAVFANSMDGRYVYALLLKRACAKLHGT